MAVPRNDQYTSYTAVQPTGATQVIGTETVVGLLADGNGDLIYATGTSTPTDANTGYAKGCLFVDTNVATGTTGLYCNKGTNTSCVFSAITQG